MSARPTDAVIAEDSTAGCHYWSISQVADALRADGVSSRGITRHLLQRIEQVDAQLHSFVTVTTDSALEQAQRADEELSRGIDRGPLHGVPVALKDNIYTAEAPTTAGSSFLGPYLPREDSTVARRLKDGGAVLLGKLAMTEGAVSDYPANRPAPLNPWDRDHWPGLSSSGSAIATAAGLCYAAIGTDSGGSIRMPAAACGVSAIKPTWGRVSTHGVFPFCRARDHVGPLARSALDAASVLGVIAGEDPDDPTSLADTVDDYAAAGDSEISRLRLGVDLEDLATDSDTDVRDALSGAIDLIESLGARIQEIDYPIVDSFLKFCYDEPLVEIALNHRPYLEAHRSEYGAGLLAAIEAGLDVPAARVVEGRNEGMSLRGEIDRRLAAVDALLVPVFKRRIPTVEMMSARLSDADEYVRVYGRYTFPFNASGHPTVTIPCGSDSNGLPIALQLVGRHLDESLILRVAVAFQGVASWHLRQPPLDREEPTPFPV